MSKTIIAIIIIVVVVGLGFWFYNWQSQEQKSNQPESSQSADPVAVDNEKTQLKIEDIEEGTGRLADNGDIVVALVDEAVTLKRFFMEKNRVMLKAENAAFPPIFTQNVRILGKLTFLIRNYDQ